MRERPCQKTIGETTSKGEKLNLGKLKIETRPTLKLPFKAVSYKMCETGNIGSKISSTDAHYVLIGLLFRHEVWIMSKLIKMCKLIFAQFRVDNDGAADGGIKSSVRVSNTRSATSNNP